MSRTYRDIPASKFKENSLNFFEEKAGQNHTTMVRDKDNHHCPYSKPSDFKRQHNRRWRSHVNQQTRKIEQHMWNNPTDKIGITYLVASVDDLDVTFPDKKRFEPYYW
jgi:hypothetical protein